MRHVMEDYLWSPFRCTSTLRSAGCSCASTGNPVSCRGVVRTGFVYLQTLRQLVSGSQYPQWGYSSDNLVLLPIFWELSVEVRHQWNTLDDLLYPFTICSLPELLNLSMSRVKTMALECTQHEARQINGIKVLLWARQSFQITKIPTVLPMPYGVA